MNHTTIWQDIDTSVQQALTERLDVVVEHELVQRSDTLLARMPNLIGAPSISTALVLRRYQLALHQEICCGTQPRTVAANVEDELRGLTRSILLSIGSTEGVSVEAAVGLALVVYKRGVSHFCALPIEPITPSKR